MSSSRFEVAKVSGNNGEPLVAKEERRGSTNSLADETSGLVQNKDQDGKVNSLKKAESDGFIMMNVKTNEEPNPPVPVSNEVPEVDVNPETKAEGNRFHVEFVGVPNQEKSGPVSPGHETLQSDSHDTYSKTYYQRTFGHNTQEAVPMVAYYRNTASMTNKAARPSLGQLHDAHADIDVESRSRSQPTEEPSGDQEPQNLQAPIKFGWIKGVLVRCMLNIWGVMLFLRLSWVVGQAGIGFSLLIILLSSVVTVITTLSMSAICTNGQVRGGGAYYLISRSLGPEFGGAIGLIFSLANAIAVSMYVVGFAETIVDLLIENNVGITGSKMNDIRIIGAITVLVLLGITQLGMAWESKMQIVLLFILLLSILNFLIGTFIPASLSKKSDGFFNYQTSIAAENFGPSFRNDQNFFSLFSIFFPAATGILAGCNISGDLKDAQKAIPKGTLLAILITSIVYAIISIILGSIEVRFASGDIVDCIVNATVYNCTTAACQLGCYYNMSLAPGCEQSADSTMRCFSSGLLNDYQAMQKISWFGPIIIAGIVAATLSSALASLVSAPKIFQAVCRDKIFPLIGFFGKGAPGSDEPRRGYILAFVIALGFILIGDLNAIAPIISNFFLASYTLINYSCFSASLAKSPGWRPAFKYYNMWLSFIGALVCCAIMFVIQWWAALITIVIVAALYKYVDYKKPDVNWGSSTQAYIYTQALNHTLKLTSVDDHVKNFRPQLLVLSGPVNHRPALVHFASQASKNISLMVCGNVVMNKGKRNLRTNMIDNQESQRWLKKQHLKAFYQSVVADNLETGVSTLMQLSGLGKLRTNTLLMGFMTDWKQSKGEEIIQYINIIHNAFDMNFGVCILRMAEGLDVSQYMSNDDNIIIESKTDSSGLKRDDSYLSEPSNVGDSSEVINLKNSSNKGSSNRLVHIASAAKDMAGDVNAAKLKASSQFQSIQGKDKTIDVWWLFDDGGLTILLPYLLSTRKQWAGCKVRIFTGGKKDRIDQDKRTMAQLLTKFRISFEDVIVVPDINMKPNKISQQNFENLIEPYRLHDEAEDAVESKEEDAWKITDNELKIHKDKTNRQVRLQELLQKHSKDAALIMMTLPMARKGNCSAPLYMAWLEELTRDLPPMVLLRGNQTSVLTFYS
uniref:Solute carrier family 12 member 2 n=1 Tax=Phallusia mammillata TaxID=59560 RepID=A0A6F9DRN3_9ASCI|nr:solute carrier family 12 member 2 [Phallusia mammillata]